jgi:hypothetical protein
MIKKKAVPTTGIEFNGRVMKYLNKPSVEKLFKGFLRVFPTTTEKLDFCEVATTSRP